MIVKDIIEFDIVNYKLPSMYIVTSRCNNFKCDKECGIRICQNSRLVREPDIRISNGRIKDKYINNPLTKAIVFSGLEPFDTFDDMYELIEELRKVTNDDVVIYTGYLEKEITGNINRLAKIPNIIIKFGRFIPNQISHFDEVLGVELASENQYGKRIS